MPDLLLIFCLLLCTIEELFYLRMGSTFDNWLNSAGSLGKCAQDKSVVEGKNGSAEPVFLPLVQGLGMNNLSFFSSLI